MVVRGDFLLSFNFTCTGWIVVSYLGQKQTASEVMVGANTQN